MVTGEFKTLKRALQNMSTKELKRLCAFNSDGSKTNRRVLVAARAEINQRKAAAAPARPEELRGDKCSKTKEGDK